METQEPLSHFREKENKYGQKTYVPVIDVRDGIAERMMARQMEGANNRSRFIPYNRYHISPKQAQNLSL